MRGRLAIPENLRAQLLDCGIAPTDLVLYINSTCNLRCKHCYIGNDLLNSSEVYNTDDINRFVNEFERLDRVTILGGEPLLHSGINSIIDNIAQKEVDELRITTNLTVLTIFDYKRHSRKPLVICVSLDGHTEDIHDFVRGEGTFKTTVANIKLLIEEGYDIELTHTLMSHNIKYFFDFVRFCKSLRIKKLNLHKISLQGNTEKNTDLYVLPTQWISLCREIESTLSMEPVPPNPLRLRYPLLFTSKEEFENLLSEGKYHHHYQRSFYTKQTGQRIVIYPDKKIYISSEAFGTELYIGHIDNGLFHYNQTKQNEIELFRRLGGFAIKVMSHELGIEDNQLVALSVSFKKTLFV
jgi:sulfatase maturation enzyme AslB (radical SAM superfamily)